MTLGSTLTHLFVVSTLVFFTCVAPAQASLSAEIQNESDSDEYTQLSDDLSSLTLLTDSLQVAWKNLVTQMLDAETRIRDFEYFDTDQERARAYLLMMRSLLKGLEEQILNDPDHPYFRIMDPRTREGGDNPDQRYSFAEIKGGESYRIFGSLGSASRLEVQLYAGQPWADDGRSVDYLAHEAIQFDENGDFEITLCGDCSAQKGVYLTNASDSTTVMVRQIYSDWTSDYPGELHIDRVGFEGKQKRVPSVASVSQQILDVASTMHQSALAWPKVVKTRYTERREANVVSPLIDTFQFGGARGRWLASGHFEINDDEALVIRAWPTSADYQAVQLTDLWFASLDYANRTSSFTLDQSVVSPDGSVYYVIAKADPGYANWLDPSELERGAFILRFDGVQGKIPDDKHPKAILLALDDLPNFIPGYKFNLLGQADREQQIAQRRRHVQTRFGF